MDVEIGDVIQTEDFITNSEGLDCPVFRSELVNVVRVEMGLFFFEGIEFGLFL